MYKPIKNFKQSKKPERFKTYKNIRVPITKINTSFVVLRVTATIKRVSGAYAKRGRTNNLVT